MIRKVRIPHQKLKWRLLPNLVVLILATLIGAVSYFFFSPTVDLTDNDIANSQNEVADAADDEATNVAAPTNQASHTASMPASNTETMQAASDAASAATSSSTTTSARPNTAATQRKKTKSVAFGALTPILAEQAVPFALSEDEAASPPLTDKHLAAFKGTYYSIALGNPQAGDFNGSTYDDLLTQLGEPSSRSTVHVAGHDVQTVTWDDLPNAGDIGLSVQFIQNIAISKTYSGLAAEAQQPIITKEAYDGLITDGTVTYDSVLTLFGAPETETMTNNALSQITATWTHTSGGLGSSVTLIFENNVLTNKSQFLLE